MDPTNLILELFKVAPWIATVTTILTLTGVAYFFLRRMRGSEAIEYAKLQLQERKELASEVRALKAEEAAHRALTGAQIAELSARVRQLEGQTRWQDKYTHWLADYIDELRGYWIRDGRSPPPPRTAPPPQISHH